MSELTLLVANLLSVRKEPQFACQNAGAASMRRLGDDNRRAILDAMARLGRPVGPAMLASETGLTRNCVYGHLEAMETRGTVARISNANRSPWVLKVKNA